MPCPRCLAPNPEVAHYCYKCGNDLTSNDVGRVTAFAVKPDERVASFAIVSSIMPRGAAQRPQTYRIALIGAMAIALIAAIFGALPVAVLVAAFAIPVVYIVYLYDVNLWKDAPVPVTLVAFVGVGVLGGLWVWLASGLMPRGSVLTGGPSLVGFLVFAMLIPVVGELIRQIAPVVLARMPRFDDLMDGLTFGIIAGVAYSTADTLVRHWGLITAGFQGVSVDAATWASLLFLEGFVKPLVIGSASGIAGAEFSGLGRGYDGFTPRYYRSVVEAMIVNIVYFGGVYLLSYLPWPLVGLLASIAFGLVLLAILLLRLRRALHFGLMEGALESSARKTVGDGNIDFCARCEMPLQPGAAFCSACGTAVAAAGTLVGVAVSAQPDAPPPPDATSADAWFDAEEGRS